MRSQQRVVKLPSAGCKYFGGILPIALDKLFFQSKNTDIFLISP